MTSYRLRPAARLAAALAASTALACGDASSTGPSARVALSADAASALQTALDDARLRVMPSLEKNGPNDSLAQLMEALADAVRVRDCGAVYAAAMRADEALAAREQEDAADAPELGALHLVVTHARLLARPAPALDKQD
jgi:hypothetical protein